MSKGEDKQMADFKLPNEKQIKRLEADILGDKEAVIYLAKYEDKIKRYGAMQFLTWLCNESSYTEIAQDGIVDNLHGRVICIDDVIEEWRRSKK